MATRNFVPRGDGEGSIGTTVKNWAGGFFKKLAVGAITTAVTVLTPAADANNQQPATTGWVRSQFQSILKTVLSAAGLKYNIAQNGYICFGALFGGLILQWGKVMYTERNTDKIALTFTYPIALKTCICTVATFFTTDGDKNAYTLDPENSFFAVGDDTKSKAIAIIKKSTTDGTWISNFLILGF